MSETHEKTYRWALTELNSSMSRANDKFAAWYQVVEWIG